MKPVKFYFKSSFFNNFNTPASLILIPVGIPNRWSCSPLRTYTSEWTRAQAWCPPGSEHRQGCPELLSTLAHRFGSATLRETTWCRAGAWLHWPSSRGPGQPRYVWKREGFCQDKHLPCQADQQISYLLQPLHLNPWGAKACSRIKCKLRNYGVPSPENTETNVHKLSMCLSRVLKKY